MSSDGGRRDGSSRRWAGLLLGPVLAIVTYALLPHSYPDGHGGQLILGHAGRATSGVTVWMAVWWMTEALPLPVTALLPLAALPLAGATSMRQAAAPFAHELIYLFMGGFVIALSMQRWGLDRRVSLLALRLVGTKPGAIVAGFMGVTAGLSMWVSNTATTVMMLPIALGVIELVEGSATDEAPDESIAAGGGHSSLAICLLLGIAYSASIGGLGTLIGTPPNLFLASYAKSELGIEISFVRWMSVGLPLVAVFLPIVWLLLTRVLFRIRSARVEGGGDFIKRNLEQIGPMKTGEWVTLAVFLITAIAWVTRPLLVQLEWGGVRPLAGLSDSGIAIIAALLLFAIPVHPRRYVFAMSWDDAVKLPWGLLVLFGGGLSLASAIRANGVGEYLGHSVGFLAGLPPVVLLAGLVALMIFLTEITSNTATAATLIPIVAGLAPGLGMHPLSLVVPAAMAASCAFMLPVATPPNAVIFGAGVVSLPQMCRAGIWLNLIGILLITGLCHLLALSLLGIEVSSVMR